MIALAHRRPRGASTLVYAGRRASYRRQLAAPGRAAAGSTNSARCARRARWRRDGPRTRFSRRTSILAGYRGEAQGIGAAALGLFGKTPEALSRDDALLLAALLPDQRIDAATLARPPRLRAGAREPTAARFAGAAASMLGPARSLALDPGLAPHLADTGCLRARGMKVASTLDAERRSELAIGALRHQLQGPRRHPRARRRGDRRRQRQRRRSCLCRRHRRRLDRATGRRGQCVSAGGVDAQAIPLCAGNRARVPDSRFDPRRLARYSSTPPRGCTCRRTTTRDSRARCRRGSRWRGSLNVPAVRTLLLVGRRPVPRPAVGHRLSRAWSRTAIITVTQLRARLG